MRARVRCRVAVTSPSGAFGRHTECPDGLLDRRLQSLCRVGASGRERKDCGPFRSKGLLGHLFICPYALFDGHAQPAQHDGNDTVQQRSYLVRSTRLLLCWVLPPGACATDEIEVFARPGHAGKAIGVTDLLHDILQNKETRYAANTAPICTQSARVLGTGGQVIPRERILNGVGRFITAPARPAILDAVQYSWRDTP